MIVNSRYNPYTYEELVKPLVDYTTAYKEQEAAANTLASQAATLDSLSPDIDNAEYQNYNSWKEELKAASDQLATSGLSPEVRAKISNLSNRYNTELNPALEKIKTRSTLAKEQRDLQARNPNLIFDIDYSDTPLSNINPASTYTTYNLDNILKEVGNDVYSRMSAGEGVPSVDEYLTKYATGLSDANKITLINNAVTSGMNLGSSTYQQKEFDNYIDKIKALRTGRGTSGTGVYPTSGQLTTVNAYDGTAINVSYNKKTGKYQIKNKDKKDVVLPDNYTADDILKQYYGGDYSYINVFGSTVPRVKTKETLQNGSSRETYSVLINNKWVNLPKGGNTSKRELYKTLTGENLAALTDSEKKRRMGSISDSELESKLKKNKWKKLDVDYHDYAMYLSDALVKKMDALESVGANFNTTLYTDSNGQIVGWDIASEGDNIDAPIEDKFGA